MPFKRKKDPLPACNWVYGLKPPHAGLPAIRAQLIEATRFYNVLIAIEQRRRRLFDAFMQQNHPELEVLTRELQQLEDAIQVVRAEMKAANARNKKRISDPERKKQIKALALQKKPLYTQAKALREAVYGDPGFKARVKSIDDNARKWRLAARAAARLYWGTYNQIERSVEQAIKMSRPAPPGFRRYTGSGAVSFQSQAGTDPRALENGTLVRIVNLSEPRGDGCRIGELWFRVGSVEKGKPLWAKARIYMHRPFPEGCLIKFGHLHCQQRGRHEHWQVRFALTRVEGFGKTDCAPGGKVAIDIGWRKMTNGLRVAYWVGDDGREGEVILPEKELGIVNYIRQLQSEQSLAFDAIRILFVEWLKCGEAVPEWLAQRTQSLDKWKSAARLCRLMDFWNRNRFDGDKTIFDKLWKWHRHDRMKFDERVNLRKKQELRRRDFYRCIAAQLRREYHTLVVEAWNIAEFRTKPKVEQEQQPYGAKEYADLAAVGEFRGYLTETAAACVRIPAAMTTQACANCGNRSQEPDPQRLVHTCQTCGATYDQDRNAAVNLLNGGVPELVADTK